MSFAIATRHGYAASLENLNHVTKTTLTLRHVRNATYPIPDISIMEAMKVIGCRHSEIKTTNLVPATAGLSSNKE
jgi:hypothetical protein